MMFRGSSWRRKLMREIVNYNIMTSVVAELRYGSARCSKRCNLRCSWSKCYLLHSPLHFHTYSSSELFIAPHLDYVHAFYKNTRNVAVAKKADRSTYDAYGIAAEPNRRKCRVWNGYGHMTKLPMAISDAEISAVRFFAVCCGWTIHPTTIEAKRYILQQKCFKKWIRSTILEYDGTTFSPLHLLCHRQTDRHSLQTTVSCQQPIILRTAERSPKNDALGTCSK